MTLSGKLLQMVGPATGKARPPTLDSLTDSSTGYNRQVNPALLPLGLLNQVPASAGVRVGMLPLPGGR